MLLVGLVTVPSETFTWQTITHIKRDGIMTSGRIRILAQNIRINLSKVLNTILQGWRH